CLSCASPRPPSSPLSPYTTLFRSPDLEYPSPARSDGLARHEGLAAHVVIEALHGERRIHRLPILVLGRSPQHQLGCELDLAEVGDRKSTRLNSSPVEISYAVFCLK